MTHYTRQIVSREDLAHLVHTFYDRIRQDALLGPIFNHHIEEERWPQHLAMLTDFWEVNLFGEGRFTGRPGMKHIKVDRSLEKGMSETHFRQWLGLWFEVIDELYHGEKAELAKSRAIQMANGQFNLVTNSRNDGI